MTRNQKRRLRNERRQAWLSERLVRGTYGEHVFATGSFPYSFHKREPRLVADQPGYLLRGIIL